MCIVRKHLPYNQKTKDKLAKLPKIYLVACWASYGTLEFPFPIKYKKVKDKDTKVVRYIPLVYDFDDHNGVYPEYVLRPITSTTTGLIKGWFYTKQQAKDVADVYERCRRQKVREYATQIDAEFRHMMQAEKEKSDTDQAGSGE